MKKLVSIMLALMLIFSTVTLAYAEEVDVAQTAVNQESFDKIANFIMTNGTYENGMYKLPCEPYKGKNANLFYTEDGNIEMRFSDYGEGISMAGSATFHKDSDIADCFFSANYKLTGGYFNGKFNAKTMMENIEADDNFKITNVIYEDASASLEGEVITEEQVVRLATSVVKLHIMVAEYHLVKTLGCGFANIYAENPYNNENTNTESTPDAVTPNQSTVNSNSSTSARVPQTGQHSTIVAVMSLISVGALALIIYSNKKNFLNK